MWFGPIPIRWRAVHSNVDPNRGFTDTQTAGPFADWQHRHTFTALDENTTLVEDHIQAQPGGLVSRVMWLTLPILFAYRAWRTRRAVERGT
jgi:ligand-binding SRPBCC domain-containing protein